MLLGGVGGLKRIPDFVGQDMCWTRKEGFFLFLRGFRKDYGPASNIKGRWMPGQKQQTSC